MGFAMKTVSLIAAAAAVALTVGSLTAAAVTRKDMSQAAGYDTYRQIDAISYVFGSKRAVGYFRGDAGKCQLTMMLAEAVDPEVATPTSAARLNLAMLPGQVADFMSVEGESMTLTCGPNADTVKVKRASAAVF
jgi:hypothetical protein